VNTTRLALDALEPNKVLLLIGKVAMGALIS
jgi:hypothetical protein